MNGLPNSTNPPDALSARKRLPAGALRVQRLLPWSLGSTFSLVLLVSGGLNGLIGLLMLVIVPHIGAQQGLMMLGLGLLSISLGRFGLWLTDGPKRFHRIAKALAGAPATNPQLIPFRVAARPKITASSSFPMTVDVPTFQEFFKQSTAPPTDPSQG